MKGLENWFHPICLHPKCSNLNGEFKSFISPHHPYLGLCRHIKFAPLWGTREGGDYVAVLIFPHHGDSEKAGVIPSPSAVVSMLWAPISPGLIKIFMHMYAYVFLHVYTCRDGRMEERRKDRMQTMGPKACIKLQLLMLPCVLLCCLLGCLCWFSRASARIPHYFSPLMNGTRTFDPACVYSKYSE